MESVITECPYICAPNIMDTPDFTTKMVQLDMSGGSCIKAGTPISADGKVANDETAIGILLNDCHSCLGNARGLVVIGGRIKQDVAKNHSGITISDKAKAAMINVTFTGDGARAGGGGVLIVNITNGPEEGSLVADKTVAEIIAAARTQLVFAQYSVADTSGNGASDVIAGPLARIQTERVDGAERAILFFAGYWYDSKENSFVGGITGLRANGVDFWSYYA